METGFIGLGTMGRAMAANLLKAGHHVRVWNRSQEPVRALAGQGATGCASPTEALQAGVVISCSLTTRRSGRCCRRTCSGQVPGEPAAESNPVAHLSWENYKAYLATPTLASAPGTA